MTTESQRQLDSRHKELTELAKRNVCKCGGMLGVTWHKPNWYLYCFSCDKIRSFYQIKPKPTNAELVSERIRKAEEAAAKPTSKYNIDEIFKE